MVNSKEDYMHTIGDLRKSLGLATDNQVRNRIDAIKDLLYPHLRRGPNNQILVAEAGVAMLRELQDLYDSGLTIAQASDIMSSKAENIGSRKLSVSDGLSRNRPNLDDTGKVIELLRDEIAFLRQRVQYLEQHHCEVDAGSQKQAWWERLREDVDGS
jgi:hypothetical protein